MAMVPGSRPKQTRDETLAILAANGISVSDGVVLLGVRGYYKDSMGKVGKNDQAMYDDAIFIISPSAFKGFNANTDPQKAGLKKAMLAPGKYQYYKGRHKNKYNALRPYPEGISLPCTRDGVKSMCSLTNIHKGGYSDTFSEGCQTLYPSQWNEFINLAYEQMSKYGQKTVTYLLIEN